MARFIVLRLWRQTAIRWILETFQSFHRWHLRTSTPLWSYPLEDPAWRAVCQVGRGALKTTAVWCYRFFSLAVRIATFFKGNNLMQFAGPTSTPRNEIYATEAISSCWSGWQKCWPKHMRCNWRMAGDQRHALTFTASVKSRHSTNHPFIYRISSESARYAMYICVLGSQLHHHSPHLIFWNLSCNL